MNQQRLIYQSMLEALYDRALAGHVTPELKQRLRPVGLDLDQPLPVSLPLPIYTRCLEITVEEVFPDRSLEAGMNELARWITRAYWDSSLGRAAAYLVQRIGPNRTLAWAGRIFRSVDSYSTVRVIEEGPRRFRIETNAENVPAGFGTGVFEELLRMAGAHAPCAERLELNAGGEVYRIWWEETPRA